MASKYFNKAFSYSESDIRWAMSATISNREAARFLGCSLPTYTKYAKQYIDSTSGKTLYDLHSNQGGKGSKSRTIIRNKKLRDVPILDILEGKYPRFPWKRLQEKIVFESAIEEKCIYCDFCERRLTDSTIPLILVWKDGNRTNHHIDNLEFVCYNHYYLNYDDLRIKGSNLPDKFKGYFNDI